MSLGFNCPNKSHPDYVRLVEQYGEVEAGMMWAENGGENSSDNPYRIWGMATTGKSYLANKQPDKYIDFDTYLKPRKDEIKNLYKEGKESEAESIIIEEWKKASKFAKDSNKILLGSQQALLKSEEDILDVIYYNDDYDSFKERILSRNNEEETSDEAIKERFNSNINKIKANNSSAKKIASGKYVSEYFGNSNKESKDEKQEFSDTRLNSANAKITNNDRIIWGHPTIGKSYLKNQGADKFISLDDDYADLIAEKRDIIIEKYKKQFAEENNGEQLTKYQVQDGGSKPWNVAYNNMMQEMYEHGKAEAYKLNKTMFTSNTRLLKNNIKDFDKVINIPDQVFINRVKETRPNAKYDIREWKDQINEVLVNVDKNKIITTEGYLSELFDNNTTKNTDTASKSLENTEEQKEFSDTRLNSFKPFLQTLSLEPTITTSASKSLFVGDSINESALLTQEIGLDELLPLFLHKISSLSANRDVLSKHNLSPSGALNFEQVQAIIDKDSKLKQFLLKEAIKILSNQYPDKAVDEYTLLRDLIGDHNNIKYYTSSESKIYDGGNNFSSSTPLAGSLSRDQQTAEQRKISERFAQDANLLDKNQEIIEIPVEQLNRKLIKDFKDLTKGTKSLARYKLSKPDKYGKIYISNRTTDYQKVLSNRGKTDAEVAFRETKDSRQAEVGTELHKIQELFVTNNMTSQDDFLYEEIIKRLPGRERIDIDGLADLAFAKMAKSDNYTETKKKFLDPKTSVFEKPKKANDQGPSNMYDSITKSLLKDYIGIIMKQVEKDWTLNKEKSPADRKWNRVNIFVENFVYDENVDIGSSVDFIAIFSDGDYGILDHKFMTGIYSGGLDEFGQPIGYSLDIEKQRTSYTKTKKEQTYEHQLTSYSDVLRGKYGAKNLIFARVKPYYIKYTTNKDKKVDKDSRIASIVTSENAYGNIPISSERTGNKDLDMFLDKIKAQIDAISKDLDSRKAWNSDFITLNRFTELKNIMTSIQVGGDLSLYTKYATTFVKHVGETVETSPENYDLETINTVAGEIEFINYFLDNTNTIMKDYKDKFPDKYEEFTKTISDIFIRLKEITGIIESLRIDRVMAEANRLGISRDVFMSFKTSSDIDWLQAQTLGIKSQNNSLFQTLSRRNEELNAERIIFQRRVMQEHQTHQDALAKWASGRGMSGSNMYEPLLTEEGDLITPYTKDFYMEQSQRRDLSDRENAKWWEETFHRSDKRVNGRLSDEERFQEARANYLDKIEAAAKLKSEDAREKYVEDTMKNWDRKNDINHPEFMGWSETYFKSPKNPEKFYNDKYKYMMQPENKPLRDYYEYLIAMNAEMRKMVGGDIDVNYNFVPYVAKDMIDRMSQDGLGFSGIVTDYWNSITQGYTPNDTTKVERKGAEKEIPIMFVDFIPKDKRSMDLGKNLMMFATFINQYKHVKEMSKLAKSLRYLAVNTPLVVKDSKGNKVLNPSSSSGFEAEEKGESSNLVKLLDDMINFYVYGVTTKSDGIAETIGETNVKIIGKLQSHASAMAMSFNIKSATVGHLAARSQIMAIAEGGKYFTTEQFKKANAVMSQFDAKLMWLSMYFEPDGESEDTVKKANELSANNLVKKFGENPGYWFQRYADKADEKIILHAMLNNFGIDPVTGSMERLARLKQMHPGIEFKSIYDSVEAVDENDKSKGFRVVNQHTGQPIDFVGSTASTPEGERLRATNLNTFMSVRRKVMEMNSKVKGAVTKENVAAFNLSVGGRILGQFRRWMPPTINERLKKEQYNMTMEEFEVGRWIAFVNVAKGNYVKSVGNMLAALIPLRKHSFESMVNSPRLREMYDQFIANNPHAKSTISYEEYVEEYRSQLKILAKEIKFYGALLAAALSMYLLYGLDDEEDGFVVGAVNGLIEKLTLEVGFFIPIAGTGEAYSMLSKDPFPILKAAKDVTGIVTNGLDELKDFTFTGDDSGKDKTPFGYYLAKSAGLGNIAKYTGLTDTTKKEDTLYEFLFSGDEHNRQ